MLNNPSNQKQSQHKKSKHQDDARSGLDRRQESTEKSAQVSSDSAHSHGEDLRHSGHASQSGQSHHGGGQGASSQQHGQGGQKPQQGTYSRAGTIQQHAAAGPHGHKPISRQQADEDDAEKDDLADKDDESSSSGRKHH